MRFTKTIGIICLLTIISLSVSENLSARSKKTQKSLTISPKTKKSLNKNTSAVKYQIDAQLLPAEKKLIGSETIRWINRSDTSVNNLQFHLYYNAFRNEKTSYFKESNILKKSSRALKKYKFGEIKIKEIRIVEGEELTVKMNFISPDDRNNDDRTVMEVFLKEAVKPYQSIDIKINYTLTIPEIFSNTGYEDDYYFMAHWFPKIGVLQQNGKWNCHQYHKFGHSLSDFGEYKVGLTVPEKYVIGATGNLINKSKNTDGTYTFIFEEKNIHDFAWVAYPHFKEIVERIKLKDNKEETKMIILLSPHHNKAASLYLNTIKFAMLFYAKHIFPYPYKTITIVDPPLKAWKSSQNGYPTLLTLDYLFFLPDCIKYSEMITIHQFGRQYWYGMVGNDEVREAWLTEGINTFFDMEIMEKFLNGRNSYIDFPVLRLSSWQYHRYQFLPLLAVDRVKQYSWNFFSKSSYDGNVKSKAGIFLRSLKNHVGQKKMMDFFQFYAKKYKYKHSTTEDFINSFNQFMGSSFTWAFDQFIIGDNNLDHSVYSVESIQTESNPKRYRNEVIVLRNKGFFPVDVLIKLKNGKEIKQYWEKMESWKRMIFEDNSPIDYAILDPQYKIPLDRNLLNNSKTLKSSKTSSLKLTAKLGFLFQNLLSFLFL
jgi:hypothetical protein